MHLQHRYNAACAAALAGSGQGQDRPALDETARARWRQQAREWLNSDLAAWAKILERNSLESRLLIRQNLQHWKGDGDLAGIRDEAALAHLPAGEQKAYRALWSRVDGLLAAAYGPASH
jgi:hypothetical protein